jgi:hypothetical protein
MVLTVSFCAAEQEKHGVSMDELLQPFPGVQSWMQRVKSKTAPHYEEVHAIIRRFALLKGGSRSPTMAVEASSKL